MPIPIQKNRSLAGGADATASGGTGPQPQQPDQPQQQAQQAPGTGFVNLQRVLDANRTGAQQMGQQLAGNVQQEGQQAQAALAAGKQAFNTAVGAGTLTFDANRPQSRQDAASIAAQGYTGPSSYRETSLGADALTSQTAEAQDDAKALTSMGGRAALLARNAPGNYSAGGKALDAYLAGAGMGNQGQEAATAYGNLSDLLAQARGDTQGVIDKAKADSATAAGQYRSMGWLDGDNTGTPVSTPAPPPAPTLGNMYVNRNDPNYLNAGDPRFKWPPQR